MITFFSTLRLLFQLAWKDSLLRWGYLTLLILVFVWGSFLIWRLLPLAVSHQGLIYHYNIYLGIDDVRSWPWVFSYPLGMSGILVLNVLGSIGVIRENAVASRALWILSAFLVLCWIIGTFVLLAMNV